MPEITFALAVASFIAGVLMFLAPCTLPLVPAYLAFISGVKTDGLSIHTKQRQLRINSFAFVLGFTVIFTLFGVLAGFFGSFIGPFRDLLSQLGGAFIIVFGLMMLGVLRFNLLMNTYALRTPTIFVPGHPSSAFLIGSFFALGWTPCIGPVLASVLLLATTAATAISGGLLLFIFSIGLALPFLCTAFLYSQASKTIAHLALLSVAINWIGGLFLILIGTLMLFDSFELTIFYGYKFFDVIGLEGLFEYY